MLKGRLKMSASNSKRVPSASRCVTSITDELRWQQVDILEANIAYSTTLCFKKETVVKFS